MVGGSVAAARPQPVRVELRVERVEQLVTVVGVHQHAGAGDEHRVEQLGGRVVDEGVEDAHGRAGVGVQGAVRVRDRGAHLREVGDDDRSEPLAEVAGLAGEDVHDGVVLRRGQCQDEVAGGASVAQSPFGQAQPEAAQRGTQPLEGVVVVGIVGQGEHVEAEPLDQHELVLERHRRGQLRGGRHRAGPAPGSGEQPTLRDAQHWLCDELVGQSCGGVAVGGEQRGFRPGVQALLIEERPDRSGERVAGPAQQAGFVRGGLDEVDEVTPRREVALFDDRGRGDLEVDVAEKSGVVVVGGRVIGIRGRCGEPDHRGVRQSVDERADHQRPVVEQMVALVEHDRGHVEVDQRIDERTSVGVQERLDVPALVDQLATQPPCARADLPAVAGGVGLGHLLDACGRRLCVGDLLVDDQLLAPLLDGGGLQTVVAAVLGGDALVGEHVDGPQRPRVVRAHLARELAVVGEQRDLVGPLPGDRRGGREHDRRTRAPAHELETDDRLARAGWRDEVQPPLVELLDAGEHEPLVGPPREDEREAGQPVNMRSDGSSMDARAAGGADVRMDCVAGVDRRRRRQGTGRGRQGARGRSPGRGRVVRARH